MSGLIDVWINCPDRMTAERIAEACIDERLAACANILAPVSSIYRWEGKRERAEEIPLLLKTREDLFEALSKRVKELHPHRVPSIHAAAMSMVDATFADWVRSETR